MSDDPATHTVLGMTGAELQEFEDELLADPVIQANIAEFQRLHGLAHAQRAIADLSLNELRWVAANVQTIKELANDA